MWNEILCENTGIAMPVSAANVNSLLAIIALQAVRSDSFCTHEILHSTLPKRRSGALLSNDRCAPITTAGHRDMSCARCDDCVITLEAMSVGYIMSPNMIMALSRPWRNV